MFYELEKYCLNKTVCIVGPAELRENMTKYIDSHDVVVRMNTYKKIDDDNYGTKNNIYFGSFLYNSTIDNDFEYIIGLCDRSFSNMEKFKKYHKFKKSIYLTPDENDNDVMKEIFHNKKIESTTGGRIVCIFLYLLKYLKKLSIVSMSFGLTQYHIMYHGITTENYGDLYKDDRDFITIKINMLDKENREKIYIENNIFREYIENYSNLT